MHRSLILQLGALACGLGCYPSHAIAEPTPIPYSAVIPLPGSHPPKVATDWALAPCDARQRRHLRARDGQGDDPALNKCGRISGEQEAAGAMR